jgi:hypothetical protein
VLALGSSHGGWVGDQLESVVALGVGSTGAEILGVLLTLVGVLFLTGASLGAIVRRSGHAVKNASTRVRRERAPGPPPLPEPSLDPPSFTPIPKHEAPVDAVHDYPDLVSTAPPILLAPISEADDPTEDTQTSLFEADREPRPEYRLPEPSLLHRSAPGTGPNAEASRRTAEASVCPANLGVEATVVGQIPASRHAPRAPARSGH